MTGSWGQNGCWTLLGLAPGQVSLSLQLLLTYPFASVPLSALRPQAPGST